MDEFNWDGKFEWIENKPITDEQREQLSIEDRLKRERILARYMAAYKGRWILVKDQIIISSANTLDEVIDRKPMSEVDSVRRVPEKRMHHAFLAKAA